MLMGMARAWKRAVDAGELTFEHNIVFLLFDSEEWATMAGSSGYVDAMSDEEQENFLGIYNMDMIATNQPETIHLFLCISSPLIDGLQRNMELLPWDESDDLSKYTDEQVRLILKPEALKIMDEFSTFGNSMIAIKKLDENGRHKKRVNIVDPKHPDFGKDLNLEKYTGLTHGSGTDNVRFMHAVYGSLNNSRPTGYTGEWPPAANFVYEWPGGRKFNPNLRNSLQYTWRKHRRGLSPTMSVGVMLEELYHKAGDNMEINYSRDRLEIMGDVISLAVYLSAEGSMELGGDGDDDGDGDDERDLGCNVGYALAMLLVVLVPFFIKKRK
jgi:Synergist-CTERM protein sorting domain-containing protein